MGNKTENVGKVVEVDASHNLICGLGFLLAVSKDKRSLPIIENLMAEIGTDMFFTCLYEAQDFIMKMLNEGEELYGDTAK